MQPDDASAGSCPAQHCWDHDSPCRRSPGFATVTKHSPLGRTCRGKTRRVPGFHGRQILSSRHCLPNQAEMDERVWQVPSPHPEARLGLSAEKKNRNSSGTSLLPRSRMCRWSRMSADLTLYRSCGLLRSV